MRCENAAQWKAMPSHLTWTTLRVIHITTTTAADSLRILNLETKERSILQKVLDTTMDLILIVSDIMRSDD